MAVVVPNAVKANWLENVLNTVAPQDLVLRLFTNDYTPNSDSTAANFTEADGNGNGYSPISLVAASWAITPGQPAVAEYPAQVFTFTGALGNVFGFFVTEAISGKLKWVERFTTGPFNMQTNGTLTITLKLTAALAG